MNATPGNLEFENDRSVASQRSFWNMCTHCVLCVMQANCVLCVCSLFSKRVPGRDWGTRSGPPHGQWLPALWLTLALRQNTANVSHFTLPSRVPLGVWQLRRDGLRSFYRFQPLTAHAHSRNARCFDPKCKSSGVVVSPKEMFMNAAAIPVSRSDRIHQWGGGSDPHFRMRYHFTLSFHDLCIISKNRPRVW